MERKHLSTLMKLCINEYHGKDQWTYTEISKEDIQEAYISLVEMEHRALERIIERVKTLNSDELNKLFDSIKSNI